MFPANLQVRLKYIRLYLFTDMALIKNNAHVAAQISFELSKMKSDGRIPNSTAKTPDNNNSPVNS